MRTILAATLGRVAAARATDAAAILGDAAAARDPGEAACELGEAASAALEAACVAGAAALEAAALRAARETRGVPPRRAYADTLRALNSALPVQAGPYPDNVVALAFLDGRATAAETVAAGLAPAAAPTSRETIQRLFVRTLMAADGRYRADRERALEAACAIETSCYNAAVRASKESEEPPRRQWDSPAFVAIYSTRCGSVCGLLNPRSSACRAYGATLVPRLLDGELAPGALGDMSEKELCPQATAAESAVLKKRQEQRVEEKESIMFRCPHCGERRSSYVEVQRRALDEGADFMCRCLNPKCGHRFVGRS